MKILFANEELRHECNNQELLVRRLGANRARLLRQRLDEMFNAETLSDLRSLPHLGLPEPAHGPAADLPLDLGAPWKLVFRPTGPASHNGGTDWNKVDSIIILALRKSDAKPKP